MYRTERGRDQLDIIAFSFNATMPVILCMVLGLFSRRAGLLDKGMSSRLGSFCFSVLLPVMIFYSIYSADFAAEFSLNLVLFVGISQVCLIAALCLIFFSTVKDKARAATYVHLCYRSNFSMYGIALAYGMFGAVGIQVAAMLLPIVLILYNFVAVVLFSYCCVKEDSPPGEIVREFFLNLLKNPLIIATVVGLIVSVSSITLPTFLYTTTQNISGMAVPLCLIVVGAQIDFGGFKKDARTVGLMSCARLVVIPLIMTPIAIYMGFRGVALAALLVIVSSPCATSGAIMAQKYNIYPDLTNQTLATTTVFGGLTNFVWISILRYFEFF